MAEAVVRAVINKAVNIAGDHLLQTGSRLYHLEENISWIERQMRTLESYLKDAESKKARNRQVANFIINIRDLAQDVDNILDTYHTEIESHNTRGPFHFLNYASCIMCYGGTAYNLDREIEKIKKRAAELEAFKENITVDAEAGANVDADMWDNRRSFLRAPQSRVFGRGETLQTLEEKLLSENEQCRIISVVGPGGVGKTTVAKKIYQKVKNKFKSSAMVYVSQEPKVGELLLDIAKQVGLSEGDREYNLEENLHSLLEEKSYVIFLDDVWNIKTWNLLRNVLVTNSQNGSRIIVTSRDTDVGRYIGGEEFLVPLKILSEGEGKELFFNLILATSEEAPLPPALKDVGEKIVKCCGGLPLAIVVAVGMLQATGRSIHAWKQVLESMSRGDENDCLKILALSYKDLPAELQQLFLYFGIFPQDHEIFVSELIHLWVAEKLVHVDGCRKPENIVEANMEKLISRNLIQVCKRRSDGRTKSCRIHDLLHSLCVREAEDSNLFCTWNSLQSSGLASVVRRITFNSYSLSEHKFQNFRVPGKLRTLLCFTKDNEFFMFMKRSASNLKFLGLLIIEFCDGRVHLPDEIGKLSCLVYLKLGGQFNAGPSTISTLKKLVTLEIISKSSLVLSLVPQDILQMKHLKHLILRSVEIAESSKGCVSNKCRYPAEKVEVALPSLETLDFDCVYGYSLTRNSFKKLSNLRKLCIFGAKELTFEVLSDSTLVLPKLENLKIRQYSGSSSDMPRLDLSHYQNLEKLKLHFDKSMAITSSVEFPSNLVKISLYDIDMEDDPMELLKGLCKLEIIKLKYCVASNLDFCGENSFPQLQVLVLWDVSFSELIVDERGMPKLYKMIYKHPRYPQWQIIPERLKNLMVTN